MRDVPYGDAFTEASQCLQQLYDDCEKPFEECSRLAEYTCTLLHDNRLQEISGLIKRLSVIYRTAESGPVKTAIENIFLYRVGDAIFLSERRHELMALLQDLFHGILMKQVITFGP